MVLGLLALLPLLVRRSCGHGMGGVPMAGVAGSFALVLAALRRGDHDPRLRTRSADPSAIPIAIGTGALSGLALYGRYCLHPWNVPLGCWGSVVRALPLLTGFAVTRLAARDTPADGMIPARQGASAAVCATATAVRLLAAGRSAFDTVVMPLKLLSPVAAPME